MNRFLAALFMVLALSAPFAGARAGSTFSNLPAASQPISESSTFGPTYVPMDQGSGCPSLSPCSTVQSDALRLGQPIQTTCASIASPWQYQLCIDTSVSPKQLKEYIGTTWFELAQLDPTNGYIYTLGNATALSLNLTGSSAPTNGIYLPTTNTLGFSTNGSEAMSLNASGNLNITGVYTSGGSPATTMQLSSGTSFPQVSFVESNSTHVTQLEITNSGSGNGTVSELTANTSCANCFVDLYAEDLGSSTGSANIAVGSGLTQGLIINAATTAPSLNVTGNTCPANGMYLDTTNTIGWCTNGGGVMSLNASGVLVAVGGFSSVGPTPTSMVLQNSTNIPQVFFSESNAGNISELMMENTGTGAGTFSNITAMTGTSGSYIAIGVADSGVATLQNGGATTGLNISLLAGDLSITTLPTSAGSGGIYVCVDNTGKLYKKSSCP